MGNALRVAALLLLAVRCWAGESANEVGWRVWFEPKSMRAPVTAAIPGAVRTELCAGFLGEDGMTYLTKAELATMKVDWAQFAAKARANSAADLASIKPRYERNRRKVIEFAELRSDRPIVGSAVLASKFLDLFKNTLGEKVLVVIPNRFTAFVFPALASSYQDYWPMVSEAFRQTAWPVSVEVFEVSAAGVRAVGVYEEP